MTTTASPVRMTCPRCRQSFRLKSHPPGKTVRCPGCRADVTLSPEVPPSAGSPDDTGEAAAAVEESIRSGTGGSRGQPDVLGWLEDILIRMITGIFRFLLLHLPRECCLAVARWFPTLVQAVKVGLLSLIWLTLTFGGLAWIAGHAWLVERLGGDPESQPGWYLQTRGRWDVLLTLYSLGAIAGSGWGLYFVRRKRRRRRAARQARESHTAGTPPRVPELQEQTAG